MFLQAASLQPVWGSHIVLWCINCHVSASMARTATCVRSFRCAHQGTHWFPALVHNYVMHVCFRIKAAPGDPESLLTQAGTDRVFGRNLGSRRSALVRQRPKVTLGVLRNKNKHTNKKTFFWMLKHHEGETIIILDLRFGCFLRFLGMGPVC